MNYTVYCFQNEKLLLKRETQNREIALRVYKNYIENSKYLKDKDVVILLYCNNKRIKTYRTTWQTNFDMV